MTDAQYQSLYERALTTTHRLGLTHTWDEDVAQEAAIRIWRKGHTHATRQQMQWYVVDLDTDWSICVEQQP